MITHTVSIPEAIWTIASAACAFINARITWRAIVELLAIRARKINNIREYAAVTTVRLFSALVAVQVAFMIIGIIQMTVPPPARGGLQPVQQWMIAVIAILTEVLLVAAAWQTDRRRRWLAEKIAQFENGAEDEW